MKELKGIGSYQPKRADLISAVDENILWDKNVLGDETPEQLISTVVFTQECISHYAVGMKTDASNSSHLKQNEPPNDRAYLRYTEDISKTNQGWLSHREKHQSK